MLTTMSWAVTAWPPVGGLGGLGIVDDHFFSVNQDDQRQMIHTLLFSLQCSMWFEGFADPFIRDFGSRVIKLQSHTCFGSFRSFPLVSSSAFFTCVGD